MIIADYYIFLPLESTLRKIDSSILTREFTGIHFKCSFKSFPCILGILVSILVDMNHEKLSL